MRGRGVDIDVSERNQAMHDRMVNVNRQSCTDRRRGWKFNLYDQMSIIGGVIELQVFGKLR